MSGNYLPENAIQEDKSGLHHLYNRHLSNQIQTIKRTAFIYKLAAILAFPIVLAMGWYLLRATGSLKDAPVQLAQVTSPIGHVSKCILPDGTQIWVNTGSTITYDINRFNKTNREVNLEGEAYFEVTSDKNNPFIVSTEHADVKVTGTAFNIIAPLGASTFETILAEGNIQLQFKTAKREALSLNPNQRILFNAVKNDLVIQQVDAEMYSSWRNGELLFKDATLNDLVKELERIYDIKFHLNPESLGDFRFRGMFSYNNNLIEALEKIKKSSNVDYYIQNKKVWLRKSN